MRMALRAGVRAVNWSIYSDPVMVQTGLQQLNAPAAVISSGPVASNPEARNQIARAASISYRKSLRPQKPRAK